MRVSTLLPRHTDAEHVQRQVVLHMRRDEGLEGVGGAAEGDEAREEVRLVLLGDGLDRRQRLRGGYSGFQDETVHCLREGRRGRA